MLSILAHNSNTTSKTVPMVRLRPSKNASDVTTGHYSWNRKGFVLGSCCLILLIYSYYVYRYAGILESVKTKIMTTTIPAYNNNNKNMEQHQNHNSRITYRVVPGFRPIQQHEPWKCHLVIDDDHKKVPLFKGTNPSIDVDRALLWPEMRHLFNFSTYIDFTDLRILFMGDSVGDYMALFLEQMMIADYHDYVARGIINTTDNINNNNISIIEESSISTTIFHQCNGCGQGPGLHLTAPLANKKGAIAGWRMTGMFSRDAEGWARPNWNRGWYREDVHTLRAAVHNATSTRVAASVNNDNGNGNGNDFGQSNKSDNNHNAAAEGDFDVFVFRIPSPGWIPISAITKESLTETITLANELFGIRKVILVTMHHNNNNLNAQMYKDMIHTNDMIRQFAHHWTTKRNSMSSQHQQQNNNDNTTTNTNNSSSNSNGNGVDAVYVLENGRLNDAMMEFNARMIGFNTSTMSYIEEAYLDKIKVTHSMSVAHVCAERVKDNSTNCRRNSITADGMHLCLNIAGQRINAGLACIMQCAYNNEQHHHQQSTSDDNDNGWACATSCNDRFMSLEHVVV
jgi:hypothetical protein